MKKFLLITLAVIVILFGGLAAYIYMNADSLLAALRPELEKVATQALGTPVKVGELHLGIGLKPTVKVDGVSLGDANDKALSVENVLLSLDLMPLLSKELKITALKINHPQITAIKSDTGMRIAGLPEKSHQTAPPPEPAAKEAKSSKPNLPLSFALENFSLTNGEITLEDKTRTDAFSRLEVRDLNIASSLTIAANTLKLQNAVVSTVINKVLPVNVEVPSIALDINSANVTLEQIAIEFLKSQVLVNGALNLEQMKGKITANSSGLDLAQLAVLESLVPAVKQFPLSGSVNHDIVLNIEGPASWTMTGTVGLKEIGTKVNNFSISGLNGSVNLDANPLEQRATAKDLSLAFNSAPMKLDFSAALKEMRAVLESFQLTAFAGTISGSADAALAAPQVYNSEISIAGLDINQALGALTGTGQSPFTGTVESVTVALTGELGERLKETTGGKIAFKIRDTVLKQINVAHESFKGLLQLPLVGERISRSIPEQFREELLGKDTRISSISGVLNGNNGNFSLSNLSLIGSFFYVQGGGTLNMLGDVNLNNRIAFTKEFTSALIGQIKEMRSIPDMRGEIAFPIVISGRAPNISVVPNTKEFAKMGAEAAVREGASRLLERALQGKGSGNKGGLGGLLGF